MAEVGGIGPAVATLPRPAALKAVGPTRYPYTSLNYFTIPLAIEGGSSALEGTEGVCLGFG